LWLQLTNNSGFTGSGGTAYYMAASTQTARHVRAGHCVVSRMALARRFLNKTIPTRDVLLPAVRMYIYTMLTEITEKDGRPYFLWDDSLTWAQLRVILDNPAHPQFAYYLGKTLREADFKDIWKLVTVKTAWQHLPEAMPFLGKKRPYWLFLFNGWRRLGLLTG
jgi:hypothetical protein